MKASRGMGAVSPTKLPKATKSAVLLKKGGKVKKYDDGGKVYLGKAPTSLDPALQKGESTQDRDARLQSGSFKDERSFFEKNIAPRLSDTLSYLAEENERHKSKPVKKAKGGKVNAAGNYTKPEMRKRIVSQVKAAATQGTGAGQWSARKAQLVAKKYKAAGGGYK